MAELDKIEKMDKDLRVSNSTGHSESVGSRSSTKRSPDGPPTEGRQIPKRVVKFTHKQVSNSDAKTAQLNKSIDSLIKELQSLKTKMANASDQSPTALTSYTESFDSILLRFVHGDIKTEITKTIFIKRLQHVLSIGLSDKVLVDLLPQDGLSNEFGILTVVGRPAVSGSNTKQMRHTTPFHFAKLLIGKYLDKKYLSEDPKKSIEFIFESLLENANDFIKQEKGFVLNEEQWGLFKSCDHDQRKTKKQSSKCPKVEVIKLTTHAAEDVECAYNRTAHSEPEQRVYYLVNPEIISPKDFETVSLRLKDAMGLQKLTFSENYTEKKQKLVKKVFDNIKSQVFTPNHIDHCVEILSRFIFTLFNYRKNATFPDEGNSFNREIKYFYDHTDTDCAGKNYVCISASDINAETVDHYSGRIRLVNNEGAVVKQVATLLESMNLLLAQRELQYSMLENYYSLVSNFLARYTELHSSQTFAGIYQIQGEEADANKCIAVRKCIERVHTKVLEDLQSLEKEGISSDQRDKEQGELIIQLRQQITQVHAPWCLYQVFDLKKLDEFVLVPDELEHLDDVPRLEIYDRAYAPNQTNAIQLKSYKVIAGSDYRNGQINKVTQGGKLSPYKVPFIHTMGGVVLEGVLNESVKFHLDFIINKIFSNLSSYFQIISENFCCFLGQDKEYSISIVAALGGLEVEETLSHSSCPAEIEVVGYTTDSFSLL